MKNLFKKKLYLSLPIVIIAHNPHAFADSKYSNQFQNFDNNITAGIEEIVSNNNFTASRLTGNGQILFNNNIWLDLNIGTELSYSTNNNANPNIAQLYNNTVGNNYSISGGYAFVLGDNWNLIPNIGFSYGNALLSYNDVNSSMQQFIIHDPSFNWSIGTKLEYLIIPRRLKIASDFSYTYSVHDTVLPSDTNLISHQGYSNDILSITPELQWNVTDRFTMIGYYQYANKFAGSLQANSVYYPQSAVNSNQILKNDSTVNQFGINLGFLF